MHANMTVRVLCKLGHFLKAWYEADELNQRYALETMMHHRLGELREMLRANSGRPCTASSHPRLTHSEYWHYDYQNHKHDYAAGRV